LWHATKAWLEQLSQKMVDKSRVSEAFNSLYNIMYLQTSGSTAERLIAVDEKIAQFKAAFAGEDSMMDWFVSTWEKKKGTRIKRSCAQVPFDHW
jgi:hypothetical protein